jgi:hypothetical protein
MIETIHRTQENHDSTTTNNSAPAADLQLTNIRGSKQVRPHVFPLGEYSLCMQPYSKFPSALPPINQACVCVGRMQVFLKDSVFSVRPRMVSASANSLTTRTKVVLVIYWPSTHVFHFQVFLFWLWRHVSVSHPQADFTNVCQQLENQIIWSNCCQTFVKLAWGWYTDTETCRHSQHKKTW